jgi:hypothetical protein
VKLVSRTAVRGAGSGERLRRARGRRLAKSHWRRRARRSARACALELQETQDREAERTRERATRRPEPDTTHADTTLAQELLGMTGVSETRASREADEERILGERERDASEHARPIRQWRAGAHVSIRIALTRRVFACPRLHLVNVQPARHWVLAAAAIAHCLNTTLSVRSCSHVSHS